MRGPIFWDALAVSWKREREEGGSKEEDAPTRLEHTPSYSFDHGCLALRHSTGGHVELAFAIALKHERFSGDDKAAE
jgi:hypothetical protein